MVEMHERVLRRQSESSDSDSGRGANEKSIVDMVNIHLIKRMLKDLKLPSTDDVEQGRVRIEHALKDDKKALDGFL